MGIISRYERLEEYFQMESINWKYISDKEYKWLIKNWQGSFEKFLAAKEFMLGDKGFRRLEAQLPFDCFVFNCPNYRYLLNTCGRDRQVTFGYQLEAINKIDRQIMNGCGAILSEKNFNFMCAFNFDAPSGYPEIYCEA